MSDGTVSDLTALTYPVLSWWFGRVLCDGVLPGVGVLPPIFWRVIRLWTRIRLTKQKNQEQSQIGRAHV